MESANKALHQKSVEYANLEKQYWDAMDSDSD
jgi:hypothetical protein